LHRICRHLSTLIVALWIPATALAQAPVEVALVERRAVTSLIQLTGSVTSLRSARLSATTAGQVRSLQVDAGSEVLAGDVLLTLDDELALWQLRGAKAEADAAGLALADAQRRLNEAKALAPKQSIAQTMVRDLQAEVASDKAALQKASAEAGFRDALLERHRVVAPFDGVVSAKLTELGEWVTPGQPVIEIVATRELRLEFPITEDYRTAITPGTDIRYWLGDSAQSRSGTITRLVPVADTAARTFTLHAQPDVSDPHMAPGMSVRGELSMSAPTPHVVVPRDAVLSFADGRTVAWVVQSNGEATTAREVVIGVARSVGNSVEVVSGLSAGMEVIVKGNEALRNGQAIRVVNAGAH